MDNSNHLGSKIKFQGKDKSNLKEIIATFKNRDNINLNNIHSRIALSIFMIIIIAVLGTVAYNTHLINTQAFDVYIGEDNIGIIRNKNDVLNVAEDIRYELSKAYNMDIVFTKEISFKETHVKDELLTPIGDFKNSIKSKLAFMVYGYVLNVNGQDIAALKTQGDMENIIERIKEPFKTRIKEGEVLKDIKIVEDIRIERKEVAFNKIQEPEALYNHLLTSSEEIKIHTVEVGESFWTIAMMYDMTVEDLIAANPDANPEVVQIGDEVKLILPKPVLTVETISEIEYDKQLKYDTQIEYDDDMYNIHQKTKVAGEDGSSRLLESRTRQNGIVVKKDIIKEEITKAPVTEIVIKGTKEPPKTMATGEFLRPTRGRISSPYGMRNGRMHKGLDIASSSGTSIKAADGGKVVYVGYKGAYGKLIEIDHENGYKTRYAHNSKTLVNVGDRVYKGQEISKMGSTGRSTGSHLHFEVIKSGSNQNPSKYVN